MGTDSASSSVAGVWCSLWAAVKPCRTQKAVIVQGLGLSQRHSGVIGEPLDQGRWPLCFSLWTAPSLPVGPRRPLGSQAGGLGSLGWIGVDSMGLGRGSWAKGGALSGEGPGLGPCSFSFLGGPGGYVLIDAKGSVLR